MYTGFLYCVSFMSSNVSFGVYVEIKLFFPEGIYEKNHL